ncbi:MAG: hypothetical protein OHK0011_12090 [Turneriella sp.]
MTAKNKSKFNVNPGFAVNALKRTGLSLAASMLLAGTLNTGRVSAQEAGSEPLQGESASPEIPMDAPEPERSKVSSDQQNAEDELASIRASRTLHKYSVGSIQKQRMLAEVRKKAIKQGLSGQRLERHMRGAKMVIDSVGANSMSLELKEDGKLLFNQGERTMIMHYRIKGLIVEVDKGDGSFRRFAQFNGNKSTLSILDPVYGKEVVAVLQK